MKYFDLHCDTITECLLSGQGLYDNRLQISIRKARVCRPWVQFFAIWIPDSLRGDHAVGRFNDAYRYFLAQTDANGDSMRFCTSAGDLDDALGEFPKGGRNPCFLSVEGSAALGGDIRRLADYYRRGVRMMTLTWNGECEAGAGSMVPNARGLTPFGFELIRQMEKLGMIIDVSHLSDQGFADVAGAVSCPFVASHSNSRAVCASPRNLTDEQFEEIVRRRGVVGLNLYPPFIREEGKAGYPDILAHVEHFLALGGENTLAFGADFDGASMPKGITGISDIGKIYEFLLRHFSETVVDKLFYGNAFDFIKTTLTYSENCNTISKG